MPTVTTSDNRTLTWTGSNVSYCTLCEELFNSGHAFDHHLKYGRNGGPARHDITGMPRNSRGYLVVTLRSPDASWQDRQEQEQS